MTTIHANSALEAIPKMAALILRTSSYSLAEVEKMLTAFKIVVYVQDYKVQQIVEIHGFDEEKQQLIMEVAYERPKQRY